MRAPKLLSIVELGGYPDFSSVYQQLGYQVLAANSMRKALALLKSNLPEVIVTEFNFQSDFRDRTSSLESLMATLQQKLVNVQVVVLYEPAYSEQFERVRQRFDAIHALAFPVTAENMKQAIDKLSERH